MASLRAASTTAIGAGVLGLSLVLPWITLPGGDFERGVMIFRGEPIPATGTAPSSLPGTSAVVALLIILGLALAVLAARGHRARLPLAAVTVACALVVLVLLIDKLFLGRVASDRTAVGAGGYLGVVGVLVVALGALMVIRPPRRPWRAPAPDAPPSGQRTRAPLALGAALLTAYLITRLSFVDRFPHFLDEGLYARYADLVAHSRSKAFIALEIGQGPFFSWLGAVWVKLGFAPLTAVRLVSVTAGLLLAVVVGALARAIWGWTVAWVAAALCVLIPFFVVHDGIGIYEPLVTLIMASALFLQIVFARRPDLRIAVALGLVLGAGVLTKENTVPALALLPVSLLCFDWTERERRRRFGTWLCGAAIVVAMVIVAELVQRSSSYNAQREEAQQSILLWPVRSVSNVLDDPFGVVSQNWNVYGPALSGYVTIPLLLAALAGAVLSWRTRPRVTLVLLAWIAVPFVIGMLFQLRPFPRHAMFMVPPTLALSAYAITSGVRFARRRLSRPAAALVCSAVLAAALTPAAILDARVLAHPETASYPGLDYWQYVAGWPAGGPWEHAADQIHERSTGRPVVVLVPGGYGILSELLGDGYALVDKRSPLAARARFGVYDTADFPVDANGFGAELARRHFIRIARFARPPGPCEGPREPACGGAVLVFERGR
jgi:4-amino-4-deoxy-L-arabinose transferase-like glycosyltransferase